MDNFSAVVDVITDALTSATPFRLSYLGLMIDLRIGEIPSAFRLKHVTDFFVSLSRQVRLAQFELRIQGDGDAMRIGVDGPHADVIWMPATIVSVTTSKTVSVHVPDRSGVSRKIIV